MKKRNAKYTIVAAMLVAVSLYFIGGTYARYIDTFNGEAKTTVAKWAVVVPKDGASADKDFMVTLSSGKSDLVAENRIAPNSTVSGSIEVDLTGTEVAVEMLAEIDEESFKTAYATYLGASIDDFELTVTTSATGGTTVTGSDNEFTVLLPGQAAFTAANGKITLNISVKWTNTEEHNASDTAAGKEPQELKIPVKLTVKQHI